MRRHLSTFGPALVVAAFATGASTQLACQEPAPQTPTTPPASAAVPSATPVVAVTSEPPVVASQAPSASVPTVAAPVAFASASTAPVASSPPPSSRRVRLAMVVARALSTPAKPAPSTAPAPSANLGTLRMGDNCGGAVMKSSCGAVSPALGGHRDPPPSRVEVGLAAKPGQLAEDEARARHAISDVNRGTSLCVRAAVATDPDLPSKVHTVTVHATGSEERVNVNITPAVGSAALESCMERNISDALGGDPQPVTLTFSLRVQVDRAP